MTASTGERAVELLVTGATPTSLRITPDTVRDVDERRVAAITTGTETPHPDPHARARYGELLYQITGWPVFEDDERTYVSQLWAKDWDSPEDAVYDEQ